MEGVGQLVDVLLGGGLGRVTTGSCTLQPMSSKVPLPAFSMMFSVLSVLCPDGLLDSS